MGASEARAAKVGQANDLGGHPWVRRASTRPYRGSEGARALFHADRAEMAGVCDERRRLEGCDRCRRSRISPPPILIGGTAAALAMEEAGIAFSDTKAFDI